MSDYTVPTIGFAVAVVRNKEGKYLAVLETDDRGWWLPAGKVDRGEDSFPKAAIRETKEEAGIDVAIKGILRIERTPHGNFARMRVIYYCEPIDDHQPSVADEESVLARWVTIEEYRQLGLREGLRSSELLDWGQYLDNGGIIYPTSIFTWENAPLPKKQ
ncbi:hydrolase, NUDIX family protein [Planoprotostelium fungivorum]|uniref:Hydrolase, NUDIX family protein n=1 Tax=Planoprotostelium fungivorum TaxID=1890364 RepID=A0A2P6N4A7_9EUKA|nr:hydrolase, NUDIX family protein [Planoprotostelium fungivorum]